MQWLLRIVCWIGSAYFFWLANCQSEFPPDWTGSAGISLVVSLVLFLLPFAQELSLSGIFSFKAKVDEVKKELTEFKFDVRSHINQQNALIATAVNVRNNNIVSVHVPGLTEASNAEQMIFAERPDAKQRFDQNSKANLIEFQNMEPLELAINMAGLRIKLEYALRSYFGHSTSLEPRKDRRYFSLSRLWKEYLSENTDKDYLDPAMRFVMDVGNAGAHGQTVPPETAVEARSLANEILSIIDENNSAES